MQQIILLNKADKRTPLTNIAQDLRPDDIILRSARRSESGSRENGSRQSESDGNDSDDDADSRVSDDDDRDKLDASGDSSPDVQDGETRMITPLS